MSSGSSTHTSFNVCVEFDDVEPVSEPDYSLGTDTWRSQAVFESDISGGLGWYHYLWFEEGGIDTREEMFLFCFSNPHLYTHD